MDGIPIENRCVDVHQAQIHVDVSGAWETFTDQSANEITSSDSNYLFDKHQVEQKSIAETLTDRPTG